MGWQGARWGVVAAVCMQGAGCTRVLVLQLTHQCWSLKASLLLFNCLFFYSVCPCHMQQPGSVDGAGAHAGPDAAHAERG